MVAKLVGLGVNLRIPNTHRRSDCRDSFKCVEIGFQMGILLASMTSVACLLPVRSVKIANEVRRSTPSKWRLARIYHALPSPKGK